MKNLKYLINHIRCGFLFTHSTPMVLHNPMNTTPPHTHFGASLMSARFGASLLLVVSLLFGLSSQVAAQTADIPVITATSIDGSGVSRAHIQFGNIFGAAVSLNEILAGTARANTGITIASLAFTQPFGSPTFMALLDCDGKIYITTEGTGYNDTPFSIAVIINDPGTSSFTSGDTLNLIITVNTSQNPKLPAPQHQLFVNQLVHPPIL